MVYSHVMARYRFTEHGVGYQIGKTLQPWRPQFTVITQLVKPGSKVLDVGCGDGVLGEILIKQKNCQVFGVDLDLRGVAQAKRRGIKAKVFDANRKLPFEDQSFDCAYCNGLLEFVKDPNFTASEILRVGKIAIIEFENFGFWFYRIQHLLGRFPKLALYGHQWWQTSQTKFFSLSDFLSLPCLKNSKIEKIICVNWRNRKVSWLSRLWPNFFGRSCILQIKKS